MTSLYYDCLFRLPLRSFYAKKNTHMKQNNSLHSLKLMVFV